MHVRANDYIVLELWDFHRRAALDCAFVRQNARKRHIDSEIYVEYWLFPF